MAENQITDARRTILALMQTSDQSRREREAWAALAPSSRRRYQSALRKLRRWTERHASGAASGPDLLCDFLEAEAAAGRVNGLPIVLSALTFWQRAAGQPLTARDPMVGHCLSRLRRNAPSPRQAAALGAHELARIRETALQPRRGRLGRWEERLEVQLRAQVDVTLCHLASDAGLRRSEAARLEWSDFTEWDDGSGRLRIAPSKGHDEQVVYITPYAVAFPARPAHDAAGPRRRHARVRPDAARQDDGARHQAVRKQGAHLPSQRGADRKAHPAGLRPGRTRRPLQRPLGPRRHGATHGQGRRAPARGAAPGPLEIAGHAGQVYAQRGRRPGRPLAGFVGQTEAENGRKEVRPAGARGAHPGVKWAPKTGPQSKMYDGAINQVCGGPVRQSRNVGDTAGSHGLAHEGSYPLTRSFFRAPRCLCNASLYR